MGIRSAQLVALFAFGLFAMGCGGPVEGVPIEGKVTFNGKPVENGTIRYQGPGAESNIYSAPIQSGSYTIEKKWGVQPGKYTVSVSSMVPTGAKIKSDEAPEPVAEMIEGLPEEFNKRTKLSAEIQAGPNTQNFDLKGSPPGVGP